MKKTKRLTGGVILLTACASAHAQTTDTTELVAEKGRGANAPVIRLGTIQVQGNPADSLPPGSTRIDRSQLDDSNIESWEDFSRRGDVSVQYSSGTDSVNVRGMDRDRVVTRLDGIRVPWLTDGARGEQGGLSAVDFGSLSAIDLVKGAGAPASGAVTGYLDLHTLTPDDLLAPGHALGMLLKSGYDSADESWQGRLAMAGQLSGSDTKWLLQAGVRHGRERENQGSIGGYGPLRDLPDPENSRLHNLLLKVQHDVSAEHRVTLAGESFRMVRHIDTRLEQGAGTTYLEGANNTRSELTRQRLWAGYSYRPKSSPKPLTYADIKVYWQESALEGVQEAIRNPDARGNVSFGPFPVGRVYGYAYPYGPYGRDNQVSERGYGVVSEWGGELAAGGPLRYQWSAGVEWYASRYDQGSSGYDNCPGNLTPVPPAYSLGPRNCEFLHTNQSDVAAAEGTTWAAWGQHEISWTEGRYTLLPALRYDHFRYRPRDGGGLDGNPNAGVVDLSSNSGGRFSPSLLFRVRPAERVTIYANFGYGFKAPNVNQLYRSYGVPGTYLRVGNPQLKPEISRGWELGADFGDARRRLQIALFDNRYRDFIDDDVVLTPESPNWNPAWNGMYPFGVTGYMNRSRVRIYGAELAGNWAFDANWYTRASMAWARGSDQDTDQVINSVAPLRAMLVLGYRQNHWGAETIATFVGRRDHVADPENDFQAPGYGLLDLAAWWQPQRIKGLKLRLGVNNLFDKKYWSALNVRTGSGRTPEASDDYFTEPGRTVNLSLSYQY